ncbi:CopY/TcrY family copper transport repressor [Lactobacillus salsicarnum]|uniref:CopY/TcrY family copper transport repressor n=1 Tax=Companilactobacillus mishanensis TaxID=2486008 RepID=A0A5P0ZID7_9LACO|nr:CopY/TcrY family copper transport repressor [Companilactobacillus mishanensis]MQS52765.1 CopY/TcrY family copper transport repressor [Companilactobacillus mishanensis]MQS89533.1 CopY/TcrY family copper transport repressor [Companilactobacillus mishanensis]
MLDKELNITDAEWRIMRVIWTLDTATSRELTNVLGESMDWKPATIKTLLRRLTDKKIIEAHKDGNKFIYTANIAENETIDLASQKFFNQVCARKVGSAITNLIDESELTQDDIDKIQSALNKKVPVEDIECNCIPGKCDC